MRNGFLDNLPDLYDRPVRKKKKKVAVKQDIRYPVAVVRYVKLKCPRCHNERTQVYSHKKGNPIRYHKCLNCGFRFKSVEV